MRHVLAVVAVAVVVSLVWAPVAMAQTKWVRGTVVSVTGDTFVVKAAGNDMTFKVDKTTQVTARGAGTAQRRAEQMGQAGVKFADFVKPGVGVEVHYKDVGGAMHATEIRTGVALPGAPEEPKPPKMTASGKVTAVAADSFTVLAGGQSHVIKVDPKTMIIGKGAGTKSRELDTMGKAPVLSEFLKVGDEVSVDYKDVAGAKVAGEVRVIARAM